MPTSPPSVPDGDAWRWPEVMQSTAIAVLAGVIAIMPRLTPWWLGSLAILCLLLNLSQNRSLLRQALAGIAPLAALALPGLGVLSALWSADPATSFNTAVTALGLALSTIYLVAVTSLKFKQMTPAWRRRYLRAIPMGGFAGLAFLLVELASGSAVTRSVLTLLPALMGARGKGLTVSAGAVQDVAGFFINRNVAGLTLLAIPMLLATWLWLQGPRRAVVMGAAVTALLLVVVGSESETAKLSLVVTVLTVVMAQRRPRNVRVGLAVALTVGLLPTLTLARFPLQLGLNQATWLPFSHRDRVLIWDYNVQMAAQHPLLGAGVEAARTRHLEIARSSGTTAPPAGARPQPAWHAHNIYLQTRVDLGIVGSLLALAFGLSMLAAVARLHPRLVPWGYGMVGATMTAAISGWGMWQYWFLAGLGASIVFLTLIDREVRLRDGAVVLAR